MTHPLNGIAPLPHLGIIRVEGEDAAKFLQGQLTQDFVLLEPSEARLAAFCSPKGRMQASFVGFRRGPAEILLVCSRDLLAPTLKRLSMFVLRAKARLSDASADHALFGIAGNALKTIAPDDHPAWTLSTFGSENLVHLYPADGQPRALWVAPAGTAAPTGPALETALWQWGEVRSGIATVTPAIVDAFVPQMLNYESVGGVNFKKGCYPGQEVVARSQFRGTLKRRAYLAHADAPMAAGQELFLPSDDGTQPCGLVAQAAAAPGGGWEAIVSLQIAAAGAGDLRLGSPAGAALAVQAAPYPLLQDL
ncbi:YgfZ/GcvT domain-containing protein [Variovorax terrae]|uniref:Folate-binding protein n=1 Tax=Variovorax terrae TaxID=2923278 RepID=A0A9X1VWQ9_9BURK|nr:folate-binding protein [Variovorax terrae]MCJ0763307.1 folate-binding protein [Variovorax terrae]